MTKQLTYQKVTANTYKDLLKKLDEMEANGWYSLTIPTKHVSTFFGEDTTIWTQGIVR